MISECLADVAVKKKEVFVIGEQQTLVGYVRYSTREGDTAYRAQRLELQEAGCTTLFVERTYCFQPLNQLEKAIGFLRPGDQLTITSLDRLGQSARDVLNVQARVEAVGAGLRILGPAARGVQQHGPLTALAAVAQLEATTELDREHVRKRAERIRVDIERVGRKIKRCEEVLSHLDRVQFCVAETWSQKRLRSSSGSPGE